MTTSTADRRLRVLHVVRQFHPNRGGLEDFVANLARTQIETGIDARVLTLDRQFTRPDVILPADDVLGPIPIRRIPFRGSTRYPIAPSFLTALGDADLVHVHAIDFFYDALAATRLLHGKPLVATTHGGFFHTDAHSRLKKLWFAGPTRLSALAYRAIVACSAQDEATFAAIAGSKVVLIENGVDIGKLAGRARATKSKRLVSIGRLAANKRPDRLLAALQRLVATDRDWHLSIVGAESDWSAERLGAEIERLGLGAHVDLHVGLDDAGLARVVGGASLFVSASEYEGFGIALVEAASAGLGIVVNGNTAFRELAGRHKGIRLTDFADADTAAAAIRAAHDALPELRRVPDWVGAYAWPSVAARYGEVYRRALGPEANRAGFLQPVSASVKYRSELPASVKMQGK